MSDVVCRGGWRGGLRMRKELRKISIRRLLIHFHVYLKWLVKMVNSQNGLEILFGITSWKSGISLCISQNVIKLKKIVYLKKVEVCTSEDPSACMNTPFVRYDFSIKFRNNLWCITNSLIYKMFCLQVEELGRSVHVDEVFQQTHIRKSIGDFVNDRSRRTH